MNHRLKLWAVLLSFTPLTFAKADTTACIFDWAETAAPSLISSSVETQNISYGDFTLRYYDKTQNALIVNEKTKELLFYDVSSYIKGEKELEIYAESRKATIEVSVRKWLENGDAEQTKGVNLYLKGDKIINIKAPIKTQSGNYPGWSEPSSASVVVDYNSDISSDLYLRSADGLHEVIELTVNKIKFAPSEENLKNKFADKTNLNWVDDVQETKYQNINYQSDISIIGAERYWQSVSNCNEKRDPLPIYNSSYENTHSEHSYSFLPPITRSPYWASTSDSLADFEGSGELTLVTSEIAEFAYSPESNLRNGRIKFYAKDEIDQWVDITELLLPDDTGCILARKTLIADFNNDAKPDVFFLCVGSDYGDIEKGKGYPQVLEPNRVLLSTDSGKYENKVVDTGYPVGYAHGGTALDFNNDGNIDVITQDADFNTIPDEDQYGRTHLLLGDGKGNFEISNELDQIFDKCCYHQVEAIDLNDDGFTDLWGGDHVKTFANGKAGNKPWIILSENGKISSENKIYLPVDDFFFDPMDALKVGDNLYTIFINHDNTKVPYYWGIGIQKLNLITYEAELIYSHVGVYDVECADYIAGSDYSWFPWLHYEDGYLMPRNSCSGIKIAIDP